MSVMSGASSTSFISVAPLRFFERGRSFRQCSSLIAPVRAKNLYCSVKQSKTPAISPGFSSNEANGTKLPVRRRVANGPGVEFLSVSGILATVIGIGMISPVALGVADFLVIRHAALKAVCVAAMSFFYSLMLYQFDLRNIPRLRLTIAFVLLARFVFIPALSHFVAILGYALANAVTTSKTTEAAAAAAVALAKSSPTAKATAKSLSLPSAVLSSLFLLSTTPVGYSPTVARLSPYVYPSLLAYLTLLTLLIFPVLPGVSHAMNRIAHKSSFLNVAGTLPLVAPPPQVPILLLTTTLPALAALGLARLLPRKISARLCFASMPIAWGFATFLMASAVRGLARGGITGLVGSIGLCGGVVAMMGLFGRALGAGLLLDERAKRTLILYLCTQGAVVGAGVAPIEFASAPPVAAALVGLAFTSLFARRWSKVVIRTSTDIH